MSEIEINIQRGSTRSTTVFIDGKPLDNVRSVKLSLDAENEPYISMELHIDNLKITGTEIDVVISNKEKRKCRRKIRLTDNT